MSTVVLTAPAGVRRAILPSGIYDVGAAGTISIPSADLVEALEAGFLYSVNVGGSIYRGDLACAGNPEYPAGLVGDQYCVLTAGRVGGGSGPLVQVNDFVVCILDNVGGTHVAVGANWKILQANISKSVEGPASTVTASSLAGFDGTTGALIKEITALPNNTTATTLLATTVDTNVAAAGVTLAGTTLSADGTDAAIDITVTPKGTGSVVMSKVDINAGAIDGTKVGAASAETGRFSTVETPSIFPADNAASLALNIPVSGTDSAVHTLSLAIDGNVGIGIVATGDGAGGVGAKTISIGVGGAADILHIGDANALVDITDAHWSMTEAGVLSIVSFGANWTNAGRTVADAGILTTVDINGGSIDGVALNDISIAGVTKYWNPVKETLQALITSISDATATKPYTIVVPPGHIPEADITASTPLLLKGYVHLKGAGGSGRATIFHNVGVSFLDAGMVSGVNRLRIEGIRFETCPIIMTASTHQMVVTMIDCPINGASSLKFTGTSYATYSALELRNLNIDNNTTAMLYKFAHVSFWNCTLLGLYFEDADAYLFGCDISAGCNAVNAGVAGGWFEFNHCKIDQMTVGDEASESVLATFGVGGSENIQVHGAFTGLTAPGSVAAFTRMRAGVQYFCTTDFKLYVKTALVGTNTWVVVGAQTA